MTRINTNVSSLNAQKSLARSNASLQTALTHLSTGLRINYGKDDPAGLIASEALRSDIISVQRAITNSERANQVIVTADSALGQVSGLLNDIRGLVTEAANQGALSDDQIAANQLQVDSSLEALNRIAQTTSFQGRRLLDGSLDFITSTTPTGNFNNITDMEINQANLGAASQIDLEIEISSAAETAQITMTGNTDTQASATLTFGAGARVTAASSGAVLEVFAKDGQTGLTAKTVTLATAAIAAGTATASYAAGTLTLSVSTTGATSLATMIAAIQTYTTEWDAVDVGAVTQFATDDSGAATTAAATIAIAATSNGPDYNSMAISLTAADVGAATPTAVYSAAANTLIITIDDDEATALTAIETAIETATGASGEFAATITAGGDARQTLIGSTDQDTGATDNTLYTGGGVLDNTLTFELAGNSGTEVFTFDQYTKISKIVEAIDLVADATGVDASQTGGILTLASTQYGESAFVKVDVISEGAGGVFESSLSAARDIGTNIAATVNGFTASGDGNTLSVNTSMIDLKATITAGATDTITFSITGGGALFQLGPDVVTNQQARIGITSVNSATLRGSAGRLYLLGEGRSADLASDPTTAARIVDQVITKVASLRGRLGAFQKTTLDTNIASLNDTLENLTDAESAIRDADFAKESAELTRSQILVQSGVSVLAIANSNPQNVLALLR
ncbi:MAG TPA: flagellin [Thermoguttaceae bacterium]|nr:flagellin [Thermoguttaceae bacterium]